MRILIWHVHGSWLTAFVQGEHTYVVPVVEGRGPDGRGRARTWDWPASVVERAPDELREGIAEPDAGAEVSDLDVGVGPGGISLSFRF